MTLAQPGTAAPASPTSGPTGWRGPLARPERVFVALAVVFGALGILAMPPFRHPDEAAHFRRAYQVSQGHLVAQRQDGQVGGPLPRSLETTISYFPGLFHPRDPRLQEPGTWRMLWTLPLAPQDCVFVDFRHTAQYYTPAVYLPQALAVALARGLGGSPLALLYAGRCGGLAAWVLCGYAAVRLLPVLRWTLVLVMLAPMSFLHSQNVSADLGANALSFLWVAAVVRVALGAGPLPGRQVLLLAGLGMLLAWCKMAYGPLVLLVLLIPPRRCGPWWRYGAVVGLVVGLSAAAAGAWWLAGTAGQPAALPGWKGASVARQAAFILHRPSRLLWANLRTLNWTYLGQSLGFARTPAVRWGGQVVALYAAVLGVVTLGGGDPAVALPGRARGLLLGVVLFCALLVNTTVYLVIAHVGAVDIPVAGRYLVPLHLPLLLALYNRRLAARRAFDPAPIAAVAGLLSCAYTVWVVHSALA